MLLSKTSRFLPLVLATLMLGACRQMPWTNKDDDVLARVHNKYLYASQIQGIVNPGTPPPDSISIVKNYINNWVRQQLLLHQAERSLKQRQKDFAKQLEDYRNSLIIYEYETDFVRQKLDTVVSMAEIRDYYEKNKANFELRQNIVKASYVQLDSDSKELPRLRRLWQSGDERSKQEIERYCIQNGLNYSLWDTNWIYFNDLLKDIPIRTYNQESFLQYNRSIEVRDSDYIYLVEFSDFKIKESVAPLSMHEDNIRIIILNRRKIELLQNLQNEIFENALNNNHFEIY